MLLAVFAVAAVSRQTRVHSQVTAGLQGEPAPSPSLKHPDAACAGCHAAIYASYERTAMARGSGAAAEGLIPGSFHHRSSGMTYRVLSNHGRAWMSFSRPASEGKPALEGEQELLYFVGSGKRGRTYLYEQTGQWFELPVNFYGRRQAWAMAPAYDNVSAMPAALPVDANCLHCHAGEVETALPEARNRFPQRPFDEAGLGCNSCHGDPAQHLATGGRAPILNPDKLPVAARDSACIQCHLEGNATVYKPGRSLAQFRPGDTLSDFAVYFVRASQAAGGSRASSQYEAMLQSACRRGSGDRLTCTACHDPHSEPAPAERVAFFRARCLECHTSPAIAVKHHPEQPDCAFCHMPTRSTADISHEQLTDHNIQRRPVHDGGSAEVVPGEQLVAVGGVPTTDRELGLAYAQIAEKGDRTAGERALKLLTRAEGAGADDPALHVHLGLLQQMAGDRAGARREYGAALREDPYDSSALNNRAVLDATEGQLSEALRLLDRLVRDDPTQTAAGLDLAFLECRLGQAAESRDLAERLKKFNPDDPALQLFLDRGQLGNQTCKASRRSEPVIRH